MPTMFDSHEEFNEWFSRDIESHAEKKGGLDENQLSRLHMILKPFMLRRIKRDVEHEMAEKVLVPVHVCKCMCALYCMYNSVLVTVWIKISTCIHVESILMGGVFLKYQK